MASPVHPQQAKGLGVVYKLSTVQESGIQKLTVLQQASKNSNDPPRLLLNSVSG